MSCWLDMRNGRFFQEMDDWWRTVRNATGLRETSKVWENGFPSFPRASTYLPNPGRADLQSAVWNRRFGICIENFLKQFSKAMIAKAVENPAVYIPNRRFQTADCRSALPGFGKYVDALSEEGNTLPCNSFTPL